MQRIILAVVLILVVSVPMFGQVNRSFVSGNGNDANAATNCGPTAPCRNFAAAQGVTNSGGEIVVLDSAGYGPFSITKALSLSVPQGVYAGIRGVAGAAAVLVNTGVTGVVRLRGLDITSPGGGSTGIQIAGGTRVEVDNVRIYGATNGVDVSSTGATRVFLGDVTVEDADIGYWIRGTNNKVLTGNVAYNVLIPKVWGVNVAFKWDDSMFNGSILSAFAVTQEVVSPNAKCGGVQVMILGFSSQLNNVYPSGAPDNIPCQQP